MRAATVWIVLTLVATVPIIAAIFSPLLAWREPVYILAGFSGIIALSLLLVQPLVIGGFLPGLGGLLARRAHRLIGLALVGFVSLHVAALWVTSPPDVVDAMLFVSPTPFSVWGVVAMWAVFLSALMAVFRRRLRLRPRTWRLGHLALAIVIVIGTVVHAILIEGTMEPISKLILCVLVTASLVLLMFGTRRPSRRRTSS